jgi:very-short-patch-repair endonuclease
MCICKRCGDDYNIDNISKKYIEKNIEKYKFCSNCRKYKLCKNCGIEFHHHQNQTCSSICGKELKEKSLMLSCGTKHNFSKNSKSRIDWQNDMLEREGIQSVFQRNSIKQKIKKTILDKYGVEHISKSEKIKLKKRNTLENTLKLYPNIFKDKWILTHNKFINELGYDPRLHVFGNASKESLKVFEPLIDWCLNNAILNDDIFIGYSNKKEYFIRSEESVYFYDFVIKSKKIIIEFNGVVFHAKREQLNKNEWFNPFTKENAIDNINRTKIKYDVAKNKGFDILEIWSDEDPCVNVELCKKFIKDKL